MGKFWNNNKKILRKYITENFDRASEKPQKETKQKLQKEFRFLLKC